MWGGWPESQLALRLQACERRETTKSTEIQRGLIQFRVAETDEFENHQRRGEAGMASREQGYTRVFVLLVWGKVLVALLLGGQVGRVVRHELSPGCSLSR